MTTIDLLVSVVAPIHNDADILRDFIAETTAVLRANYMHYELLLVDDGSDDATTALLTELLPTADSLRVIRLSRAFGPEVAISAGLDAAIGDFVAVMLPDSDPPALIPTMVERSQGGAGVVFGIRQQRQGEPWWLRVGARLFYAASKRVLHLNIPRNSTHFRVLSRQAVNAVVQIRDRNRYLRTLSAYVGYASQSVEYQTRQRRAVPRTKSVRQAVYIALSIIVSNSLQPLYLSVALGVVTVLGCTAFVAYVVSVYMVKAHVAEGWTTQAALMGTMFGALGAMLTVATAYLARLLDENRERPLYFVLDERQSARGFHEDQRMNIVSDSLER